MATNFGIYVFDEKAMEKHLPAAAFKKMQSIIKKGGLLDPTLADSVAFGMREWGMGLGANCFAHWFHPLTEKTAHKYDAFLTLRQGAGASDRRILNQFSGRQLVQGEPDGSSFPSGGLRRTSAARGYTAWDYTSPPFVVHDDFCGCLYIPTVFCSIFGLSLDQRTPLLKSECALREAALRAVRIFEDCVFVLSSPMITDGTVTAPPVAGSRGGGDGSARDSPVFEGGDRVGDVRVTVGIEQEMFILDKALVDRRPDITACGRTLVGRAPLRGQELNDHYWSVMPPRVRDALRDTQARLWELGVPVVTTHNEVAPGQFEFAVHYERGSIASDHNMLLMRILEEECARHGLACLFHEKPLGPHANGSGKHLNWSLATDTGENLFVPGEGVRHNLRFLFFLAAFLRAVHDHSDVLRAATAVHGNEFRLGGMEAPPAVISVFLGDHIGGIVEEIVKGTRRVTAAGEAATQDPLLDLGIPTIARVTLDVADRNRTSPIAYVGNRFEFRAVGSSQNCAWPATVLNTIMAESLTAMCNELWELTASAAYPSPSLSPSPTSSPTQHQQQQLPQIAALQSIIRSTLARCHSVVYNGDCYDEAYVREMTGVRGLLNLADTPAALDSWDTPKNRRLFSDLRVMKEEEVEARGKVWASTYCKVREMEARTLLAMVDTAIVPAAIRYQNRVAQAVAHTADVVRTEDCALLETERKALVELVSAVANLQNLSEKLKGALAEAQSGGRESPRFYHDTVLKLMESIRNACDAVEGMVPADSWPYPTLTDMCSHF